MDDGAHVRPFPVGHQVDADLGGRAGTVVDDAPAGYKMVPERAVAVVNRKIDVTVHTL